MIQEASAAVEVREEVMVLHLEVHRTVLVLREVQATILCRVSHRAPREVMAHQVKTII